MLTTTAEPLSIGATVSTMPAAKFVPQISVATAECKFSCKHLHYSWQQLSRLDFVLTQDGCALRSRLVSDGWFHRYQEFQRGNMGLRGQGQECVRRRAALSVSMNPSCAGPGVAAQAVDIAFERCYADTAPFDRAP